MEKTIEMGSQALAARGANHRGPIRSYRDLEAWQKAMDLVVEVYQLCRAFPKQEQFGLISQAQRAAVSVVANIAEGHARLHRAEYVRLLSVSCGSLAEVETHLLVVVRLKYVTREQAKPVGELSQQVGRLLHGLVRALEKGMEEQRQGRSRLRNRSPAPSPQSLVPAVPAPNPQSPAPTSGSSPTKGKGAASERRSPVPSPQSPAPTHGSEHA